MNGDAPSRASQHVRQHRYFGRIRAEMSMDMLNAGLAKPEQYLAGLGDVDEVDGKGTLGAIEKQSNGEEHGSDQAGRMHQEHADRRKNKARSALLENVTRALALEFILLIGQQIVPFPDGDAENIDAEPFKRLNLAANERMARLGILVDEICNLHRAHLYSIKRRLRLNKRSRRHMISPIPSGNLASV